MKCRGRTLRCKDNVKAVMQQTRHSHLKLPQRFDAITCDKQVTVFGNEMPSAFVEGTGVMQEDAASIFRV